MGCLNGEGFPLGILESTAPFLLKRDAKVKFGVSVILKLQVLVENVTPKVTCTKKEENRISVIISLRETPTKRGIHLCTDGRYVSVYVNSKEGSY